MDSSPTVQLRMRLTISSSVMVRGSSPGSCNGVGEQFGGNVLGVAGCGVLAAFVEQLADVAVEFEGDLSDFFVVAAQGWRRGSSRSTR